MMIIGANFYQTDIKWFFEVELTATPSSITVNGVAVNFTVNGTVVSFSTEVYSKDAEVYIDSEGRTLTFLGDYSVNDKSKDYTPAIGEVLSNAYCVYIPYSKRGSLTVTLYKTDGSSLTVQDPYTSPFWRIDPGFFLQSYNGKTVPCCRVSVGKNCKYLISSGSTTTASTWGTLSDIHFKMVVSGDSNPLTAEIMKQFLTDDFYNKSYYCDF